MYRYLLTVLSLFKINNNSVAVQMNVILNSRGCHSHMFRLSFLVYLKRDMEKPHQEGHCVMPFMGLTMIVLQSIKTRCRFYNPYCECYFTSAKHMLVGCYILSVLNSG